MTARSFNHKVGGLTLAGGPAYSAGDQIGIENVYPLGNDSEQALRITAAGLVDRSMTMRVADLVVIVGETVPAADNDTAAWDDETMLRRLAVVHLTKIVDHRHFRLVTAVGATGASLFEADGMTTLATIRVPAQATLAVNVVARTPFPPFADADQLVVRFAVDDD